jgi:hypothetical protein
VARGYRKPTVFVRSFADVHLGVALPRDDVVTVEA